MHLRTPFSRFISIHCAHSIHDGAGIPAVNKNRSIKQGGGNKTVGSNIMHVTDGSFEQDVLGSDQPILVDYWAEWCGPCKMIAPVLEEISGEYAGRLKIAKLNIDQNPETPPKYGIRGIPTLMIFKDGEVVTTKVGAMSKAQLTAFIEGALG